MKVNPPSVAGLTTEQAGELIQEDGTIEHGTVFLVDDLTLSPGEHFLLAVTSPETVEDGVYVY